MSTNVSRPAYLVMEFDNVVIDADARTVSVAEQDVHLTRTEFDLLMAFVLRPRQALTRAQIIETVWGGSWYGDTHLISVHVSNLRRKIGDGSRRRPLIRTVHGYGYRFDGQASSTVDLAAAG